MVPDPIKVDPRGGLLFNKNFRRVVPDVNVHSRFKKKTKTNEPDSTSLSFLLFIFSCLPTLSSHLSPLFSLRSLLSSLLSLLSPHSPLLSYKQVQLHVRFTKPVGCECALISPTHLQLSLVIDCAINSCQRVWSTTHIND